MTRRASEDRALRSAPPSPRFINKALAVDRDGAVTSGHNTPSAATSNRTFHPDASVVLVGIRGSGKRSLGLIAATALGRRFVTEDHFFQTVTGFSRQDYLKNHGSEQFHQTDVEVTRRMLEENRHHCVIDCGLGSMTSSLQDYLRLYCLTNPVIYIMRDMAQIKALLNLDDRSARRLEIGDPSHRKCSNFEFYNLQDDTGTEGEDDTADRTSPTYSFKLRQAQEDVSRFMRLITGTTTSSTSLFSIDVPLEARAYTHALELPLSKFTQDLDMAALQTAGDLVEVVVDKWNSSMVKVLSKAVASIRRYIETPVAVSIRTSELGIDVRMAILNHALRLGVEHLSIDLELEAPLLANVFAIRGLTKIIGTVNRKIPSALGWRDPKLLDLVRKASNTKCDSVRIVLPAASRDDLTQLNWFREEVQTKLQLTIPMTTFSSGESGRLSQVLNTHLGSVTHPILQHPDRISEDLLAPSLTSAQALRALGSAFMLDALQFCVVGGNVTQSLSPPMHNAAYKAIGLLHSYTTRNISSWDNVETLAKNSHFGGASVVQPWKVKAVEKLSSLSQHAKAIGAVNTLLPLRSDSAGQLLPLEKQAYSRNRAGPITAWYGDNTDFIGIKVCLRRSLSPRNVIQPKTTGLVIGAGGMARAAIYAMLQLGCRNVCIYNRTIANAKMIADHFKAFVGKRNKGGLDGASTINILVLESLDESWPSGLAMPTMIVSCVSHEQIGDNPGAEFEMPNQWLESPSGGVVVEMAYMTNETVLMKQIMRFRTETGLPWVIVSGVDTLIEQAVAQFELMVGRRAPRAAMIAAAKNAMTRGR